MLENNYRRSPEEQYRAALEKQGTLPQVRVYFPEKYYPLDASQFVTSEPQSLPEAFKEAQEAKRELPQITGYVFIESPDHPATHEITKAVVTVFDSTKNTRFVGYEVSAKEAVQTAEEITTVPQIGHTLVFVEETSYPATMPEIPEILPE